MRVESFSRYDPEYAKAYREKQRAKRDAARAGGNVVAVPKPKTPPPKVDVPKDVGAGVNLLQRDESLGSACACSAEQPEESDVKWLNDSYFATLHPGDNVRFVVKPSGDRIVDEDLKAVGMHDAELRARVLKLNEIFAERFGERMTHVENALKVMGNPDHIAYIRNGETLGINPKRLTDAATLREEKKGWFPPGTGRIEDTLVHEHGHFFLQQTFGLPWASGAKRQNAELKAGVAARAAGAPPGVLGSTVSRYGQTSREEAQADLWAFYHMGGPARPAWVVRWGETYMKELGLDPTPICVDLGLCPGLRHRPPAQNERVEETIREERALTDEQYDALTPGTKTKQAIIKSLSSTEQGKNVLDAIEQFTERRGGVSTLRKSLDKVASGESVSAQLDIKIKDFVGALNNYPIEKVPQLFRGFAIKITDTSRAGWNALEAPFQVGKKLKLNVSSFTSSEKVARGFMQSPNGTRYVSSNYSQWKIVVDGPVRALPVESLSKFKSEREWFAGGEFEVTSFSAATKERPYYEVHIKQVTSLTSGVSA